MTHSRGEAGFLSTLIAFAIAGCAPPNEDGPSPRVLRRAFEPAGHFEPLPKPAVGDWLAQHRETGQTFEQFVRSKPRRPDAQRKKIYLQPVGEFPAGEGAPIKTLRDFTSSFFALEVEVLPPLPVDGSPFTMREAPDMWHRQLLTQDIVVYLSGRLPPDAFAVVGVTLEDLYPRPDWNFVFGQASPHHRVGIYSFARQDPRFYSPTPPSGWRQLLLRRSCKLLAHETGHLFGIKHCTFYHCLLNGSNHLEESDMRPLHLCPVDLRKLQHSIGFDPAARYRKLLSFSEAQGFTKEAEWLRRRLQYLTED